MAQAARFSQIESVGSEVDERNLAAAVLSQAFEDLRGIPGQRRAALDFLLEDEIDFVYWCRLLKVDPVAFRRLLLKDILGPSGTT